MELTPGNVMGEYRIERELAENASGTVFAARSDRLMRTVALQVLEPGPLADPQRTLAEARAVSQLGHPGLIEVYDTGMHEGAPWIAMELIEGETLAQRMKWGRPLAPRDALRIADQMLAALDAAHGAGFVHRDLSPDCVLVERGTDRVAIRDFGLALPADGEMSGNTATAASLGVPAYVAPEFATNAHNVTAAADVYGVGAILYKLLSGETPYDAGSLGELVQQMHRRGPRPLAEAAPGVDPQLAAAVARMLAVDPAGRPGSAGEARAMLAALGAGGAAGAGAVGPSAPGAAAAATPATMALDASALQHAVSVGANTPVHGGVTPPPGGVAPPSSGFGTPPQGGFGTPPQGGFGAPPAGPAYAPSPPAAPAKSSSGLGIILVVVGGGCLLVAAIMVVGVAAGMVFYAGSSEEMIVEPPPPLPPPQVSVSSLGLPGADAERVRIAVDDAPAIGGAEPLVTIVTFSDFQCPFCARVDPTMTRIRQTYGDRVRYVWRDNPLPFHTHAMPAAELAREAYAQGGDDRFWQLHTVLFENQGALDRASLERYSAGAGLNLVQVRTALDTHSHQARIRADMDAARTANARGTPTFFLNGRNLRGAQPFEQFRTVIEEELALANALIARGVPRANLYETFQRDAVVTPADAPAADRPPTPRPPDNTRHVIALPPDAPTRGPANAAVTIHVFSEFQCPFCNRVRPTLDQVRERYPSQVRIVWRHFPLAFHNRAMPAAQAAVEVHRQGGDEAFWRYHDLLFENREALEDADLVAYARRVPGINADRVQAALSRAEHRARVDADMAAGRALNDRMGTPTFYINGVALRGAQPFTAFQQRIDAELAAR